MNVEKINKVKEFYSKKLNTKNNKNNQNIQKPFFSKIMKKLEK
jgi:hypothetical protein